MIPNYLKSFKTEKKIRTFTRYKEIFENFRKIYSGNFGPGTRGKT